MAGNMEVLVAPGNECRDRGTLSFSFSSSQFHRFFLSPHPDPLRIPDENITRQPPPSRIRIPPLYPRSISIADVIVDLALYFLE